MSEKAVSYELSYILPSTLSDEDAVSIEGQLKECIDKSHATIESWDSPQKKRLSYPIKKMNEAYLGALRFIANPSEIPTLQQSLRERGELLRFMMLKWKKEAAPERRHVLPAPPQHKEEFVPTDERALDETLNQLFGEKNESQ